MAEGTTRAAGVGARLIAIVGPRGAPRDRVMAEYTGADDPAGEYRGQHVAWLRIPESQVPAANTRSDSLLTRLTDAVRADPPPLVAIADLRAARAALPPGTFEPLIAALHARGARLVVGIQERDDVLLLVGGWAFAWAEVAYIGPDGAVERARSASLWDTLYRPDPGPRDLGPKPAPARAPDAGSPRGGRYSPLPPADAAAAPRRGFEASRRQARDFRAFEGGPPSPRTPDAAPQQAEAAFLPSPDDADNLFVIGPRDVDDERDTSGSRGRYFGWSAGYGAAESADNDYDYDYDYYDAAVSGGGFYDTDGYDAAAGPDEDSGDYDIESDGDGGLTRFDPPLQPHAQQPARRAARYVNVLLEPVEAPFWLAAAPVAPGALRVGIGPRDSRSIVGNARQHPFPVDDLPPVADGWWLTATVEGDAVEGGRIAHPLFLPRHGPAWACPCRPGRPHTCEQAQRRAWLEFPVRIPGGRRDAELALTLYLGRILIQALRVSLQADGRQSTAVITWSRGEALGDLHAAARRSASLHESAENGRHRVLLGEGRGAYVCFELGEAQAAEAARILRGGLLAAHLQWRDGAFGRGGGWRSLYDEQLAKDEDAYLADLRALAVAGAEAYRAILADRDGRERLRHWLEAETHHRRHAPTIQLSRAAGTRVALPWQLLYQEPIAGDPAALRICPSALRFGPRRRPGQSVPPSCPDADGHAAYPGTVCPYGFWGLAYVLEVPPWSAGRELLEATGQNPPADLVMAVNPTLMPATRAAYQKALAAISGGRFALATDTENARTLLSGGADVAYFLVHGVRLTHPQRATPGIGLDLGDGIPITPTDVASWCDFSPRSPGAHHPLVVLNGCHTGEVLDDTLGEFVTAFVAGAGAAGVVATEVPLDAPVAARAGETLIRALWQGQAAGVAVRELRWDLLSRGNVMGLAYSPYCDAELTLPVHTAPAAPVLFDQGRDPHPFVEQESYPW